MYPQTHFLFSLFLGVLLAKFGIFDYWTAFYVGLAGMLVDVDHYILFLKKYRYKDFSLRDAWNRAVKGMYLGRSFIHHDLGIAIMTLIIGGIFLWNKTWFWILGLGFYSHLFVDFAHLNFLKIRERMTFREAGFTMKINKFEVLFDLFLIFGIVLVVV